MNESRSATSKTALDPDQDADDGSLPEPTPAPYPKFSHRIEAEFARILDYYGVPWEYEPRTFPLYWKEDGTVTEAFSPDFYLPEQDLYVELTTVRPKLVTRKNRKLRRLKELYPDINIQLWKRADLRTLMLRFGVDEEAERILGGDAQS